jgi:hypothetical protein
VLVNPAGFEFCHIKWRDGLGSLSDLRTSWQCPTADDAPTTAGIPRSTSNDPLSIPDDFLSSTILPSIELDVNSTDEK